jgi:hypothetical protein
MLPATLRFVIAMIARAINERMQRKQVRRLLVVHASGAASTSIIVTPLEHLR